MILELIFHFIPWLVGLFTIGYFTGKYTHKALQTMNSKKTSGKSGGANDTDSPDTEIK